MPGCIVHTCHNYSAKKNCSKDIMFHAFPNSLSRIRLWLQHIGQQHVPQEFGDIDLFAQTILARKRSSSFRVCSTHFEPESYSLCNGVRKSLKPDAVPTIFHIPDPSDILFQYPKYRAASFNMGKSTTNEATRSRIVMVDASTSTDFTVCQADKATQWPEFEFNVVGEQWKVEHDHNYHNLQHRKWKALPREGTCHGTPSCWVTNTSGECIPVHPPPEHEGLPHNDISRMSSFTESTQTMPSSKLSKVGYIPNSQTRAEINTSISENDSALERTFLVFESSLDLLLQNFTCKYGNNCHSPLVDLEKHVEGTYLSVTGLCQNGHRFHLWQSQPSRGQIALGNVLSSAAVFFSGLNFCKVREMCQLLGLQFISHSTYYRCQRQYLFPTVDYHWQEERQRLREAFVGHPICLSVDAQCYRRRSDRKYCIYTFLDTATKRIVDFKVVEGRPASTSTSMMKKALRTGLSRMLQDQFQVSTVATDFHPGVKKTLNGKYANIHHKYKFWHYAKILRKRLLAASKKKDCSGLSEWVPAVINHLWWSLKTSKGDAQMLRERWQSVLMHVTDQHVWDNGRVYHACSHRKYSEHERKLRPWVLMGSPAYFALRELVLSPRLTRELENLYPFRFSGELDLYHSFISKYQPKKNSCKLDRVEACTKLAALGHNANVHRRHGRVHCAEKARAAFSRPVLTSQWWASNYYILPMLTDVLKLVHGPLAQLCQRPSSILLDSLAVEPIHEIRSRQGFQFTDT
ncbi:uncharacterized protein RCH25_008712 [Pelodytes ibericus]